MKPQEYVKQALEDITQDVKDILMDSAKSLTEKDNLIFPYLQQKRVLKQTLEDLDFLAERKLEQTTTCKMSQYLNEP